MSGSRPEMCVTPLIPEPSSSLASSKRVSARHRGPGRSAATRLPRSCGFGARKRIHDTAYAGRCGAMEVYLQRSRDQRRAGGVQQSCGRLGNTVPPQAAATTLNATQAPYVAGCNILGASANRRTWTASALYNRQAQDVAHSTSLPRSLHGYASDIAHRSGNAGNALKWCLRAL